MTPSTALLMDLHLPGVFGRGGSDDMEAWMSQEVTLCPIKTIFWGHFICPFICPKIDSLVTCGLMMVGLLMLRHVDACTLPKMQLSEQCHVLILRAFPHEKFKQLTSHYSNASKKKKQSAPKKNSSKTCFGGWSPPSPSSSGVFNTLIGSLLPWTPCPRVPVWIKRWSATRSSISKNWCRLRTYPKAVVADSWPGW